MVNKMYKKVNGVQVELTDKEILEYNNRQEDVESTKYIADRLKEYGSVGEQLDMIFHEGLEAWKAHISAVKAKYPKPNKE